MAAIVVDGRYTLQATNQVDTKVFTVFRWRRRAPRHGSNAKLRAGARLGYDPRLHTARGAEAMRKAAAKAGDELVAQATNPLDAVWADRLPSRKPASGSIRTRSRAKRGRRSSPESARSSGRKRLDALLISDPHNLAWLFNLRGRRCRPYAARPRLRAASARRPPEPVHGSGEDHERGRARPWRDC